MRFQANVTRSLPFHSHHHQLRIRFMPLSSRFGVEPRQAIDPGQRGTRCTKGRGRL